MLDYPANQAAGLMGLAPDTAPRMLCVVSHGEEHAVLPVMWRLCEVLVTLGYGVTVLDGTQRETEHAPGLQQLLDYVHPAGMRDDSQGWSVLPAYEGLQTLGQRPSHHSAQRRARLGKLLPHSGVLILYGRAEQVLPILADTQATPLLVTTATKSSLISSYSALKRLLLEGRIEPTILNMMEGHNPSASSGAKNLGECARNFLDYEINTMSLDIHPDQPDKTMRQIAVHLLESAIALTDNAQHAHAPLQGLNLGTFARTH